MLFSGHLTTFHIELKLLYKKVEWGFPGQGVLGFLVRSGGRSKVMFVTSYSHSVGPRLGITTVFPYLGESVKWGRYYVWGRRSPGKFTWEEKAKTSNNIEIEGWMKFLQVGMGNGDTLQKGTRKVEKTSDLGRWR